MIDHFVGNLCRHLPHSIAKHEAELSRIVRFFVVGGSSAAINWSLYALLSRVIWTNGDRSLENFLATAITSIFNYIAHRSWTFRSNGAHASQGVRYVMVAVSAVLLQSGLFWVGHVLFGLYDFLVLILVSALIPFYTYLAHKSFTFAGRELDPHLVP